MNWLFLLAFCFFAAPLFADVLEEQLVNQITPDQKKKIEQLAEGFRSELEPLREEYRRKGRTLLNKIRTPARGGAFQKTIAAEADEIQVIWQKFTSLRLRMRLEMREVLTGEQINKFEWLNIPPPLKAGEGIF